MDTAQGILAAFVVASNIVYGVATTDVECPHPGYTRNGFIDMPTRTVGAIATAKCAEGYWFTGTVKRICQANGQWTGKGGICEEVLCPEMPDPPNGHIKYLGFKYKDKATVVCDDGYVYSSPLSTTLTCQGDNTWQSTIGSCEKVHCPVLRDPGNGKIQYTGIGFKDEALVVCDLGYVYSNPDYNPLVCLNDNRWNYYLESCEVVKCPNITTPEHGRVEYTGVGYRDQAKLECDEGYNYTKPDKTTQTCQGDNTWSLQFDGECLKIECPPVPFVENGVASYNSTEYAISISFTCEEGFILQGTETITCLSNGQWSTDPGVCLYIGRSTNVIESTHATVLGVFGLLGFLLSVALLVVLGIYMYRRRCRLDQSTTLDRESNGPVSHYLDRPKPQLPSSVAEVGPAKYEPLLLPGITCREESKDFLEMDERDNISNQQDETGYLEPQEPAVLTGGVNDNDVYEMEFPL